MICVYEFVNKLNGKKYIGSTQDVKNRYTNKAIKELNDEGIKLILEAAKEWHHNEYLKASLSKYGIENFEFNIVSTHDSYEEAQEHEQQIFDSYIESDNWSTLYNISQSVHGGNLGPEVNARISKKLLGKPNYKIRGEGNGMYGKTHTPEARMKMSKSRIGKKFSKGRCERQSIAAKKRFEDPEYRKAVIGENNGNAHFNRSDVERLLCYTTQCTTCIEKRRATALCKALKDELFSDRNDVTIPMISGVLTRNRWTHIDIPQKQKFIDEDIIDSYIPEVHFKGRAHTHEARTKISASNTGRKLSQETRQKISEATAGENNPMYGKKHTPDAREKMKEAWKHRAPTTNETRKKISDLTAGSNNPRAKLDEDIVYELRKHTKQFVNSQKQRRSEIFVEELRDKYNLSVTTAMIRAVLSGRSWKRVMFPVQQHCVH